jgi:hypothetical protein
MVLIAWLRASPGTDAGQTGVPSEAVIGPSPTILMEQGHHPGGAAGQRVIGHERPDRRTPQAGPGRRRSVRHRLVAEITRRNGSGGT